MVVKLLALQVTCRTLKITNIEAYMKGCLRLLLALSDFFPAKTSDSAPIEWLSIEGLGQYCCIFLLLIPLAHCSDHLAIPGRRLIDASYISTSFLHLSIHKLLLESATTFLH